jgi:hypothetical protein
MAKLTKNRSGSWTNTSASCGSESAGKICRRPANGWKNPALMPENENSSWQRRRSSSTNPM